STKSSEMQTHDREKQQSVSVHRRDVLKAIAAPFVISAMGAWSSRIAAGPLSSTNEREIPMKSRPLMTVTIAAAAPHQIGAVPHGTRNIVPVTGGTFEGPRLRGKVLAGGSDWLLLRSDGVVELDLRITLETHDHSLISMTFQGLRHGPSDVIAALNRGE